MLNWIFLRVHINHNYYFLFSHRRYISHNNNDDLCRTFNHNIIINLYCGGSSQFPSTLIILLRFV